MKSFIKTTLFVMALGALIVYSKPISEEVIAGYDSCMNFIANQTWGCSIAPLS